LDQSSVLFATEGREAETFGHFVRDLEAHGGDPLRIRDVSMDMSPAHQKGLKEHLPFARITFDRFHVVKRLNEAVDQVRQAERKEAPELARTRYLWLRNTGTLSTMQREALDILLLEQPHLKTVQACQLKLAFQDLWELGGSAARRMLDAWCAWAETSGLRPMVRFARTVQAQKEGILRWFQTRISNGILEGLSSLIQTTKARASGYRSTRNFIAMLYLMHAKLPNVQPI
jgi:transposase